MSQINKIELSIKEKKELKESELLQHLRGMKKLAILLEHNTKF